MLSLEDFFLYSIVFLLIRIHVHLAHSSISLFYGVVGSILALYLGPLSMLLS